MYGSKNTQRFGQLVCSFSPYVHSFVYRSLNVRWYVAYHTHTHTQRNVAQKESKRAGNTKQTDSFQLFSVAFSFDFRCLNFIGSFPLCLFSLYLSFLALLFVVCVVLYLLVYTKHHTERSYCFYSVFRNTNIQLGLTLKYI